MKRKAPKKTAPRLRRIVGRLAQTKTQAKPRKIREARTVIVSFRLRQSEADLLMKDLRTQPIAGVRSVKQYARKLTIDHAMRRTVYVDPLDYKIGPDSRKDLVTIPPPSCQIDSPKFRKALTAFITTGENWRKLRHFMLLAGWPAEALSSYNNAETDQERLLIAQEVLTRMAKS